MVRTGTHTRAPILEPDLAEADDGTEDNGPKTNAEHSVNEVASEDGEDDIGPGVERVEQRILCHVHIHYLAEQENHHKLLC